MVEFGVACGVLAVWLGSGAIGGYVAAERSRSPVEGAIFGLVLGPIGVLVEVMMPSRRRRPARREGASGGGFRVASERWDTDRRNAFDPVELG